MSGWIKEKRSAKSSFEVQFQDGNESLWANGRADDGYDESIITARIAEHAVLNGVGKIKKITPISLQVALKSGSEAESFTFTRTWTPPRLVLKLAAGPLAFLSVRFLVSDADLAVEDTLLGLPVLGNLGIDTKTLLEERRDLLHGPDCSSVKFCSSSENGGRVSWLMIARLNRMSNDLVSSTKADHYLRGNAVDYYQVRGEKDPFPDPSVLDPLDLDQTENIRAGIQKMIKEATQNGLRKTPLRF